MKNKKYWIATSIVTLLPILAGLLLWDQLPDRMPTHFGVGGEVDGWSGKPFAVFGVPLMMLAFHVIVYACTLLDKQNRGHNQKVLDLVGLIFPAMSVLFGTVIYAIALDLEFSMTTLMLPILGLFFILIGNWLPKIKQNSTLGIKIKWTLYSEENWNKTHRVGGYCWVIGGVIFCIMGFVSDSVLLWLMPANLILMAVAPMVYSWRLAKRQQAGGTYTESPVNQRLNQNPILKIVSIVLVTAILIFVAVVMFTGEIDYQFQTDQLVIDADFWDDLTVSYDEIDSIEFRDTAPAGSRDWGWGSPRLMMGYFSNDEFGGHTRYSYTGCDAYVVLYSDDDVLILNAQDEAATRALYEELLSRIP